MKILIVNQFFWPDVAATGQFLTDLVRILGRQHQVTVICSGGRYAEAGSDEEPPPVSIVRIPGWRYRRGFIGRALSYSLFFAGALWKQFRLARPDLVITMTTPPGLAVAGTLLKKTRKVRHFIWEMDVFPDALVSVGTLNPRGLAARVLGALENFCRRRCDGIVVLGPCMRRRLAARGIPRELIRVAENWADGAAIAAGSYRRAGPLRVLYSGNLGVCHDLATTAAALRRFRNDPRFVFTFAGGGVGRAQLQRICEAEQILNARFLPYAAREDIGEHLAEADVGLVTERPECIGVIVPSKLYGLMAAGRPVLFIGPRKATPGLAIRRFHCGWQVDPGDTEALAMLLERLYANRQEIAFRGRLARRAFERCYDLPRGVARLLAAFDLGRAQVAFPVEPRGKGAWA